MLIVQEVLGRALLVNVARCVLQARVPTTNCDISSSNCVKMPSKIIKVSVVVVYGCCYCCLWFWNEDAMELERRLLGNIDASYYEAPLNGIYLDHIFEKGM